MRKIHQALRATISDRKERGYQTQKSLAAMMSAEPAMVSALLKGDRRLNQDWIGIFCDALGITLEASRGRLRF